LEFAECEGWEVPLAGTLPLALSFAARRGVGAGLFRDARPEKIHILQRRYIYGKARGFPLEQALRFEP